MMVKTDRAKHTGTLKAGLGKLSLLLCLLASPVAALAQSAIPPATIELELNKSQAEEDGCSLYFVARNRNAAAFEELRLEFIVFDKQGSISRRLVADLGPLKPSRTTVKVFKTADKCEAIDGLLINSAKSCGAQVPLEQCLDGIKPSSRAGIKLFM